MELNVAMRKGESEEQAAARTALRPTVQAALTSYDLLNQGKFFQQDLDINALVNELAAQTKKAVIDGDLSRGEAMLTVQAHTLDAIYNNLTRRAMNAELLDQFEAYMKLGLRAQSQCRSTWEAISEIQNPRATTFVKQANIAHGHQQVNNASRTGENENPPNELLEHKEHEPDNWLDRGAPQEAVRVDQTLETVAKKHRPKDS